MQLGERAEGLTARPPRFGLRISVTPCEETVLSGKCRCVNPIVSSKGTAYLNDMLGTTVAAKSARRCSAAALTAFGEPLPGADGGAFFTGKPQVDGLGYAFLYRNYRPDLAKWQTADPLGYPDGWNQLAYGVNSPLEGVDLLGAAWDNVDFVDYYFDQDPSRPNYIDTDQMGLTGAVHPVVRGGADNRIDSMVRSFINGANQDSGHGSQQVSAMFPVDCGSIVWAMGGGSGRATGLLTYSWWMDRFWYADHLYEKKLYTWQFDGNLVYSDSFKDPADVLNLIGKDIEIPYGRPYNYGHTWNNQFLYGDGCIWARMIE